MKQNLLVYNEVLENGLTCSDKKEAFRKSLFLFLLSFLTGIWAGSFVFFNSDFLRTSNGFQIIFGGGIVVFWLLYVLKSKSYKQKWDRLTDQIKAEFTNKSEFQDEESEETDQNKQIKSFASCRHQQLTSTLKELHSLMSSHLTNVTHETNDAALNLINQLRLIYDAMSYLLQTVSENQKESSELASDTQSTLDVNRETMDGLEHYIDKRIQEIDHDHLMASEIKEQAAVMSDLTNMIESVAKQTTIVATNAKIESTRAGAFGQAFGVIADEVTSLSAKIGSASKQIIKSIDQLGKSIDVKFKTKLDYKAKKEETELLNGLKNQLANIGTSYLQLEEFNRDTLDNINRSSEDIKTKVNDSLMAIQFQDITQQQIEVVLKSLGMFEEYLSNLDCFKLVGSKGLDYEEFDVNQIRNLYVMKKQRDIHQQHHQTKETSPIQNQDTDSGDITLF